MPSRYFSFMIGGPAGFGIMSTGLTFSKLAIRSGYNIYDYTEYPSIIRGGHNVMQVVVSNNVVTAPVKHTDLLIALNKETIGLHINEMSDGGFVVFDGEGDSAPDGIRGNPALQETARNDIKWVGVPLVKIAKDLGGSELMRNTVALGAALALIDGDLEILMQLIAEEFVGKEEDVTKHNQDAARAGYEYIKNKILNIKYLENSFKMVNLRSSTSVHEKNNMVVTGNEAVGMGAIAAGLQFAAIYPMTPTSNILHFLAPLQEKYGFVYKQPEDEISAINMAIGASFAGVRSMVASSGGGFCLMTEGYGLAGMTEVPIVIIEGMRGAPATGVPTWTEQGDLRFVLHAHQGDFPRIVLAAGDAEEAFHLTMQAFNLADKYQAPVLILIDKMICESHQSYPMFDYDNYQINRGKMVFEKQEGYQRFALSEDGISPRSILGVGNHVVGNSDEHVEAGYSTEESEMRIKQMNKRMKKLQVCEQEDMAQPVVYGPETADVTIVSWGSNKGAILQAMAIMENEAWSMENGNNKTVNFIHNIWMNPFPARRMRELLLRARYLLNIECNYSAQYASLVKEKTGIDILDSILKYDDRPVYPEEIVNHIKNKI